MARLPWWAKSKATSEWVVVARFEVRKLICLPFHSDLKAVVPQRDCEDLERLNLQAACFSAVEWG